MLRKAQGCLILGQRYLSSWNLQVAWQTSKLYFYPKIQHRDYNLLTPVPSGILNINKESCLLAASSVVSMKDDGFSNNWGVHLLKVITWLQTAWKSVSMETIKQCFKKCGWRWRYINHKRRDWHWILSVLPRFLVKSHLVNISTLMWRQLHQSQLLIQHM